VVASVYPPDSVKNLWNPSPHRLSNYRFVHPHHRDRWRARFTIDNETVWLGSRPTQREAAQLAVAFLRERYGDDWPARHREAVAAKNRAKRAGDRGPDPRGGTKWPAGQGQSPA
jgi:hypothetical protein